jgi:hypothetical protein
MRRWWLIGFATLVAACGRSSTPTAAPLEAPIVILGDGDTVSMHEMARIGTLEGPEEYQFASVSWLLSGRNGGVFVHDRTGGNVGSVIRQFDANGDFVRWVGAKGEGPGEYADFPAATILRDGALLVAEQGTRRVTVFDTAGQFERMTHASGLIVDQFPADDGGWYIASVTGHPPNKPRAISYFRYGRDGTLLDSISAPAAYHDGPWEEFPTRGPRSFTIILPDGRTVSARTDTIAFTIHAADGDRTFAWTSDRARYTEGEKEDLVRREQVGARLRSHPDRATLSLPDLKQAFWYLVSDPWGRIHFLRRTQGFPRQDSLGLSPMESRFVDRLEVDIFGSNGDYRGRLVAPLGVLGRVPGFGERDVWLAHEGADGAPQLVRWRPERPVW